jgi:alpha-tubulin suppressor-like RCC1 family protein
VALAGGTEGLAVKSDGTVWRCWTPIRAARDILEASQVGGLDRVRSLSASATHAVASKNDGTLWAWGNNSFGQLGDGTKKFRPLPVRVGEIPEVTSVAAGQGHTLALAKDGTIWMWGDNSHEKLCTSITVSSTAFPSRCEGF